MGRFRSSLLRDTRPACAPPQRFACALAVRPRMVRGQDGSLLLSCMTLSFTTSRRFIPTLTSLVGCSPLLDLLRQLDSADRDPRIVESFEPEHRPDPLFHSPMVLFDQVIQILAGSHLHSPRKFPIFLHLPHRPMGCCIGVQGDLRRFMRVLHRSAEKALGRIHIPLSAQKEIDRSPCLIHRPVEVDPMSADLYIRLIHPPGSAELSEHHASTASRIPAGNAGSKGESWCGPA